MTNYTFSYRDNNWFAADTWINSVTQQPGQPGPGDIATIGDGALPAVSNAYLDGPIISITGNNAAGLSAYNSVLGGDSPIFVQAGTPTLLLNNSVLYDNLFAQAGSTTLSVPAGGYGVNIGTTIVGGIPVSPPIPPEDRNQFYTGYNRASLAINDSGAFINYAGEYAFNSGTITFAGSVTNDGVVAANAGTVAIAFGTFDDEGTLLATNGGTVDLTAGLTIGQNGTLAVNNNGAFVLGGSIAGAGVLDLDGGRMEFTNAATISLAPTTTVEFTGAAFTLGFDGATALSDAVVPASGSGGHAALIVAADYGGSAVRLFNLSLEAGYNYSATQFTQSTFAGNALIPPGINLNFSAAPTSS